MAKHKTEAEQYQEDVYEFLDQKPAGIYDLTEFVKTKNRAKFIEILRQYIEERGRANGYNVMFSEKTQRIHKWDTVLTPINKIL